LTEAPKTKSPNHFLKKAVKPHCLNCLSDQKRLKAISRILSEEKHDRFSAVFRYGETPSLIFEIACSQDNKLHPNVRQSI